MHKTCLVIQTGLVQVMVVMVGCFVHLQFARLFSSFIHSILKQRITIRMRQPAI